MLVTSGSTSNTEKGCNTDNGICGGLLVILAGYGFSFGDPEPSRGLERR